MTPTENRLRALKLCLACCELDDLAAGICADNPALLAQVRALRAALAGELRADLADLAGEATETAPVP